MSLVIDWENDVGTLGRLPPEIVADMAMMLDKVSILRFSMVNTKIRALFFSYYKLKNTLEDIEDEVWLYKTFRLVTRHLYHEYGLGKPRDSALKYMTPRIRDLEPHQRSLLSLLENGDGIDTAQHFSPETLQAIVDDYNQDYDVFKYTNLALNPTDIPALVENIMENELETAEVLLYPVWTLLRGMLTPENIKYLSEKDVLRFGTGWGVHNRHKNGILADIFAFQNYAWDELIDLGYERECCGVKLMDQYGVDCEIADELANNEIVDYDDLAWRWKRDKETERRRYHNARRGRMIYGGLRFGEMERDATVAHPRF